MTTLAQPRRHVSSLFSHHSSRAPGMQSEEEQLDRRPGLFEGTDAITQNRRVALQRVLEVHNVLVERSRQIEPVVPSGPTSERPGSSLSASSTGLATSLMEMDMPDIELRSFHYLVRRWDPCAPADPEFEEAIAATRELFEETAARHFLQRIALWHASDEVKEDMYRSRWRRRERSKSQVVKVPTAVLAEGSARDLLKETTTQEGLAQLLWTQLHDNHMPLAPGLMAECTEALKKKYGMAW